MIKIEGLTVHISGDLPLIMFELEQLIRGVKEGIEKEKGPEFAKECINEVIANALLSDEEVDIKADEYLQNASSEELEQFNKFVNDNILKMKERGN